MIHIYATYFNTIKRNALLFYLSTINFLSRIIPSHQIYTVVSALKYKKPVSDFCCKTFVMVKRNELVT